MADGGTAAWSRGRGARPSWPAKAEWAWRLGPATERFKEKGLGPQ
jgi:hypothetical protein